MNIIPEDLMYTESHEWVRDNDDGTSTIGITDHAQSLLGDVVFVELPEIDTDLTVGNDCAIVESVKAASDIYSPITGTVVAVNEQLTESPEIINSSPYDEGWICAIDSDSADNLMNAEQYKQFIED